MLMLALTILLLCIAAAVLSAPLVLQRLEPYALRPPAHGGPSREDARAAEQLLDALSELEQSRLSGKLSDADYAAQRGRLEAEYLRFTAPPVGDDG